MKERTLALKKTSDDVCPWAGALAKAWTSLCVMPGTNRGAKSSGSVLGPSLVLDPPARCGMAGPHQAAGLAAVARA